jgi:hypothetical protein
VVVGVVAVSQLWKIWLLEVFVWLIRGGHWYGCKSASRARVEEQRKESQQEEGKEMWDLLLDQEPKPLPLSQVPTRRRTEKRSGFSTIRLKEGLDGLPYSKRRGLTLSTEIFLPSQDKAKLSFIGLRL